MPVSVGELMAYLRLNSAEFDAGISSAQAEMGRAAGTATKMTGAVDSTSAALAGAGRSAQVASAGSAKFRAAQLSAVAATERYNAVLAEGDASLARRASAEAAVIRANQRLADSTVAMSSATAKANVVAAETPGRMASMATGFASAARSAVGLGAAFGAFEIVKKAIDISKEAAQFQASMLLIRTNANASAAEVTNMTAAVLKLSPQVATSPLDLANALYHVEQNGLRGATALEALKVGAEGAKIGMANVEDTTNTMTIALASGIKGMGSLQQAMGTMIAIAGTGDMRVKDLNEAMSGGILAVAKGFGATLGDVAAVLATLGDNGIRGADAATALRQVLMGFAAPAAKGKQELEGIGLTMTSLADDMEKHGLVYAMNDLNDHMKAAGVTGAKVGSFITDAFGKRAGAGLGVLIGEIDRLNTKFDEGQKGAASFADKWKATTETVSFQFKKLGVEVEAAGITLAEKLGPALSSAATWIGTTVPHALGQLQAALAPVEHDVGVVFALAWRAAGAAASAAGTAMAAVGHVVASNKGVVTDLATATLALWATFKGVTIGLAAFKAIQTAAILTSVRVLELRDSMLAVASGEEVMSMAGYGAAIAAVGVAFYALGKIMSGWLDTSTMTFNTLGKLTKIQESFKSALDATNGALTDQVRKSVGAQLQSTGLAAKYEAANISLTKLTDVVTGSASAYRAFSEQTKGNSKVTGDMRTALLELTGTYRGTAKDAKDLATVTQNLAAAHKALAAATESPATAMKNITADYEAATKGAADYLTAIDTFSKSAGTAADRATLIGATLKANAGDALDFAAQMNAAATASAQLGTDIASAAKGIGKGGESTRSFLDSIIQLKWGTIDYSNAAAAPLISNLQSIQTAAINAATATFQHNRAFESGKKAADDAVAGYQGVESSLEGQLEKLGLTSGAAQRLTQKYLGVPSKVRTLIEQEGANPIVSVLNKIGTQLAYLTGHPWVAAVGVHDAASQRLENIKYLEDELHDKTITITTYNQLITAGTGSSTAGHHASGGTITGPGTGTSDSVPIMASTGEEVINARQAGKHRALLKAINAGRDGFATGGTVGSAIVAAGLAAAIRPPSSTTPQTFQRALAYDIPVANTAETRALAALAAYTKLEAELKRVEAEDRQASAAARGHTGALQDQAHSLADLAAKLRAEASTAKSAYSTIGAAAKSAASKAADAAKSMIASLQSEVDAEKSAVSDFTSSVAQGIAGDFSVATLWGNVTTAAQTAADNLKAAQDAVNQATPDTASLAAAQTAQATATSKLAAAHKALADAQAAVAAGHGSPAQYAQLTTAEQGQSDAVTGLAAANQSLQAAQQAVANTAGPTADQLQALTDAQNAYNAAVANNGVAGLQNNLNQILASTKSFSTDLTALAKSGADQDFVAQIAAMGTTAGDALAKQLLAAGPSAIKSLQTTMLAISNVAGQEGDDLGKAFFGKGENALSQLAAGMKKQFPSLKTALAPIIAQLNAMFTFTPTVATLATTTHALEQAHTVGWLATNYHESVAQLLAANPGLKGASSGTVVGKGTKLTVPSFANGVKNFTGTAWVGEQGPELVNFARPVDVHRSGTPIIDITPLVNRLDAIERRLAAAPALIGAEVSTSGVGLYATAGKTHAHEVRRAFRKGAV